MRPVEVVYCTESQFKKEEWGIIRTLPFKRGKVEDYCTIEFRVVETEEPLLCDIEMMVQTKSASAYRAALVPCIVEHAGLILKGYESQSFPGGLTQPMWDALGAENFCTKL